MKRFKTCLIVILTGLSSTKCMKAQTDDLVLKYDNVESYHEGFAPVKLNNKWGFINTPNTK